MEHLFCPTCGAPNLLTADACVHCQADLLPVRSVINTANKHYNTALELARDDQNEAAIRELRLAVELWGENPNYHNLLGTCLAKMQQYAEAIQAWDRCLELNPAFQKAHNNVEKAKKFLTGEPETGATPRAKNTPLLAGLAVLFFLAAAGAGVYAFLGQRGTQDILAQNQEVLDGVRDELTEMRSRNRDLERQLDAALVDAASRELQVADLQTTLQTMNTRRDQEFVPKSEVQSQVTQARNALNREIQRRDEQIQGLSEQLAAQTEELEAARSNTGVASDVHNEQVASLTAENKRLAGELTTLRENLRTLRDTVANLRTANTGQNEKAAALEADVASAKAAVEELNQALADWTAQDALVADAIRSFAQNAYPEAATLASRAVAIGPDHRTATVLLDLARERGREWSDPMNRALREFQEAQAREQADSIRKTVVDANLARAKRDLDQKNYAGAVESASLVLALDPSRTAAAPMLDSALEGMRRQAEDFALVSSQVNDRVASGANPFETLAFADSYRDAVQYHPNFPSMYAFLQERADEADAELTRRIEAARPALLAEDFAAAEQALAEVVAVNPANAAARDFAATLERARRAAGERRERELERAATESLDQGDPVSARQYLDQAAEEFPASRRFDALRKRLQSVSGGGSR